MLEMIEDLSHELQVELAEQLAKSENKDWNKLSPEEQGIFYFRAGLKEIGKEN